MTDVIYYGALKPCIQCKNGRFVFRNSNYVCNGNISEWARCDNYAEEPERQPTVIPEHIRLLIPCLDAKYPVQTRVSILNSEHSKASRITFADDDGEDVEDASNTSQKMEIKSELCLSFTIYKNSLSFFSEH